MEQPPMGRKIFSERHLPQKIFILLLNFLQRIVLDRWVFPVPGMSDYHISKWDLHQVAEKSCRQNILFPGTMRWMPFLLFKKWESRSVPISLFLRYEPLMKIICGCRPATSRLQSPFISPGNRNG